MLIELVAYCKDWNNITREGTQNNQQTLCLTERGRSKSENWPERLESKRSWFPLARCVFVLRAIRRRRVMESRQLWAQRSSVSSHHTYKIWCGSVHALLRYRSKTTKMQKKIPIDSHSNENFITPFFGPPKAANPQNGRRQEKSVRGLRPHKLWRESVGRLSRNRWPNKKTEKHTVKQIPCPKDGATVLKVGGTILLAPLAKKFFDPPLFGQWEDKYCLDSLFCQPNSSVWFVADWWCWYFLLLSLCFQR